MIFELTVKKRACSEQWSFSNQKKVELTFEIVNDVLQTQLNETRHCREIPFGIFRNDSPQMTHIGSRIILSGLVRTLYASSLIRIHEGLRLSRLHGAVLRSCSQIAHILFIFDIIRNNAVPHVEANRSKKEAVIVGDSALLSEKFES